MGKKGRMGSNRTASPEENEGSCGECVADRDPIPMARWYLEVLA